MNIEEAKINVGKLVMSTDAGFKMIHSVSIPHGPYTLLKVTKAGLAILSDSPEGLRVPVSLLRLYKGKESVA